MPLGLAIIACGVGLIYFVTRGFTDEGIRFSHETTLVGPTAKVVGVVCVVFGVGLAVGGACTVIIAASRGVPAR